MYERVTMLSLVVLLGPINSVRADKLILHDGRILSGQDTVDKGENLAERTYRIVTDDGRTLTFGKDEVIRHKHECRLSNAELREQFDQWQALVKPVLDTQEPKHREFHTEWRMKNPGAPGSSTANSESRGRVHLDSPS